MFKIIKPRYFIFFVICLFLFACKTSRKATDPAKFKALSVLDLNKIILSHQTDFKFFEGRAKVNASQNGSGLGVTAQIRMKKNEYLWMAISKLGFEIARAYITPDSAFVLDRFHKEYYAENLEGYLEEYQIPFDFSELQGLFIGNAPFPRGAKMTADLDGFMYEVIYRDEDRSSYTYGVDGLTKKLYSSLVIDANQRSAASTFTNYGDTNLKGQSPFHVSHEIKDADNIVSLDINYIEMSFNIENSAPFEIPSHYAKVQ